MNISQCTFSLRKSNVECSLTNYASQFSAKMGFLALEIFFCGNEVTFELAFSQLDQVKDIPGVSEPSFFFYSFKCFSWPKLQICDQNILIQKRDQVEFYQRDNGQYNSPVFYLKISPSILGSKFLKQELHIVCRNLKYIYINILNFRISSRHQVRGGALGGGGVAFQIFQVALKSKAYSVTDPSKWLMPCSISID